MQKNTLEAKVAFITGAARRIGAEIAHTLHDAGMNIILHFNTSEEDAISLCEEFNKARNHSAIAIRGNLEEPETIEALIKKGYEEWNRLDALINNASRFYKTEFGKVTDFAWEDLMASNLKAPFFLAQAAAPYLAEQQGSIVNITDIHGDRPMRDYSVYCISKSGLLMMTKMLAKELGPLVRVNAVSPGAIMWPEGKNSLSDEEKQKIINQTTLLRAGSASDIAKAVLFFLRDAEYITGQVINVDGGRLLSS